ncbi:MAG: heterodisulfide reductase-related iron-sulfur binding cluster [Gemmatimonadales bacterium]|nr:heterodisulfide reductase-related iron-sulfur binding cluster [Gemmatimonadales bacterium]
MAEPPVAAPPSARPADHPSAYTALDPCVHCGFCLPACPTYLATGDEADSPRGRIVLMRALERGELSPFDEALNTHLDQCLGCRACEPACPSGVGYGRGLEAARAELHDARGLPAPMRALLALFRHPALWRPAFALTRWLRDLGLARRLAGGGRIGFGFGMVAATAPAPMAPAADGRAGGRAEGGPQPAPGSAQEDRTARPPAPARVALFRGCIMQGLFAHVHEATARTLRVNGYEVIEVPGLGCCGALHEHAGDQAAARALAEANVRALAAVADTIDHVVVNSAGCGAILKDYGHLLGTDVAARLAARVRDVTELLAAAGPRPGAPLPLDVAYDAPCHLQHAQRVHAEALAVLAAIPGLRWRLLPGSDRCCGSAGIYSVFRPGMARAVLADKLAAARSVSPPPALIATGNPGCLMQIGAGLRAEGMAMEVCHPVELLDASYRRAGLC